MKTESPSQWIEQFLQDLRYGLRVVRQGPGFAAIIVLTLGLAIGATTAIFTLLDYMVMRSLPVRKPQELMVVAEPDQFSYPTYQRLHDLNNFCTEMVGVSTLPEMLFSLPEQAEASAKGSLVSGNYFAALGVNTFLGRTILPSDDGVAESSPVAVISYDFWQRAFNGSRDVLGQKIRVRSNPGYAATSGLDIYDGAGTRSREGAVLTIVGVTPPGFFGHVIGASTDLWIPLTMQPAVMPGRPWLDKSNVRWVNIMGRLKPDVTQRQAGLAMTVGNDIGRVCKNILDRIAALPGVRSATFSENGLFYGPESQTRIEVEGFVPGSVADQRARFDQVGPGYFSSLGIPLLLGRDFTERDGPTAPRVVVINETLAKFFFPEGNPIGKHIVTSVGGRRLQSEVVGVSRDVQDHSFWSDHVSRFYVSYFQPIDGITEANFAIRTVGNPANFEAMLRQEVRTVDPGLMILSIRDLHSLMDRSLEQIRLLADVSAFFGLLAAALAAIGLCGVMSYDVARRTKEIGIRTALGAQRRDVLGMFLRNGLKLTVVGLALGTGLALLWRGC